MSFIVDFMILCLKISPSSGNSSESRLERTVPTRTSAPHESHCRTPSSIPSRFRIPALRLPMPPTPPPVASRPPPQQIPSSHPPRSCCPPHSARLARSPSPQPPPLPDRSGPLLPSRPPSTKAPKSPPQAQSPTQRLQAQARPPSPSSNMAGSPSPRAPGFPGSRGARPFERNPA